MFIFSISLLLFFVVGGGFFIANWSGWEQIGQKGILAETMCLEFFQTATEKEVQWISEESLFSWDFLPSLYPTCPNSSNTLQMNSRLFHRVWDQVVSEAYPVSSTDNLGDYNSKADRGYPTAGPVSRWPLTSCPAWPSEVGLEPAPFFPASCSVGPASLSSTACCWQIVQWHLPQRNASLPSYKELTLKDPVLAFSLVWLLCAMELSICLPVKI